MAKWKRRIKKRRIQRQIEKAEEKNRKADENKKGLIKYGIKTW